MFSSAPEGGLILWCPRVTPKSTPAHPRCRKQDLLSALGGGLSEPLRPKRRPVRQRSGLAVTEEWRPGRRRATRLPEEEQATQSDELSGQRCYATATSGLHRSWWTPVCARSGNCLHSVQPCGSPRARHGRLLDGFLPLQRHTNASALPLTYMRLRVRRYRRPREMSASGAAKVKSMRSSRYLCCPRLSPSTEGLRVAAVCAQVSPETCETSKRRSIANFVEAFGLYTSLRYPVLSARCVPTSTQRQLRQHGGRVPAAAANCL